MRRPVVAILATFAAVVFCLAAIFFTGTPRNVTHFDVYELQVKDRDLLTPEQQRLLVRNGRVDVWIDGNLVTFHNDEGMRPYLNEGGVR